MVGVGLGLLGLGAAVVIGSAIASHPGYYAYEYDGPPPVQCDGYWGRKRVLRPLRQSNRLERAALVLPLIGA